MKPRVSIVIPAYNEGPQIEDVLTRLTEIVSTSQRDRGRRRLTGGLDASLCGEICQGGRTRPCPHQ